MPAKRAYLFSWLATALALYMLLGASALALGLSPQAFYWRAWEYFQDVVFPNQDAAPLWQGPEKGDLSRSFLFLYQDARPTKVSTDRDGFRVVPLAARTYRLAVLGDSTIFGSGLADDETLPWLLASELGEPVFNGGRTDPANALANPALAGVRLVVEGRTERVLNRLDALGELPAAKFEPLHRGQKGLLNSVPLAMYFLPSIMDRALERAGYDLEYLWRHRGRLGPYLFHRHVYRPADLDKAAGLILARQKALAARGIAYVFLPVPAKQTFYADDVDPFTRDFIPRLCQRLNQSGLPALDLTPAFAAQRHQGLYPPADTHWNGRATRIAARELADLLRHGGLLARALDQDGAAALAARP